MRRLLRLIPMIEDENSHITHHLTRTSVAARSNQAIGPHTAPVHTVSLLAALFTALACAHAYTCPCARSSLSSVKRGDKSRSKQSWTFVAVMICSGRMDVVERHIACCDQSISIVPLSAPVCPPQTTSRSRIERASSRVSRSCRNVVPRPQLPSVPAARPLLSAARSTASSRELVELEDDVSDVQCTRCYGF
jgi:hypothetical protein